MEKLDAIFQLMSAYYHECGKNMAKFSTAHSQSQVDLVVDVLDLLNKEAKNNG